MKKALLIMLLGACCQAGFAQEDTTKAKTKEETPDTIRVGSIIIVKKGGPHNEDYTVHTDYTYHDHYKPKNITTNWLVVDLGYAGFDDRTNYSSDEAQAFLHDPGNTPLNAGDFSTKGFKVSNFSLWFFMQRLNLYKHVINLKYGFGIENNNYYYKTSITYVDGANPYVIRDSVLFSKNKIAADFFTAPLMININTMPNKRYGGLQISFGISAGYMYSARQKQISDERGKQKNKTDFNLEHWKLAYVGELGLGPVRLYGSYAFTPLHKYGVDQHPYTIGLRFSAW